MAKLKTFEQFAKERELKVSFLNGRFYRGWRQMKYSNFCEFAIRGVYFCVLDGKRFINPDMSTITASEYDSFYSRK